MVPIVNTVLVTLGVAAGDVIEQNLRYLDFLVVAAVVVAVAWFVHCEAPGKLNRRQPAGLSDAWFRRSERTDRAVYALPMA